MLQVTQIGYRSSSPKLLKFRFYVKENGWALLTETTLVASEGLLFIGISSCTIFNCRSYSLASVFYVRKHIYIFYVFLLCKKFWDVGFPLCCWDREKRHPAVRDLPPTSLTPHSKLLHESLMEDEDLIQTKLMGALGNFASSEHVKAKISF